MSVSSTTTSAAAAAADREAQETLVTLLRRERNDAISSLAAAKAELEIAREDLDAVIRKRRNSPSPSRANSSRSGTAAANGSLGGNSGGNSGGVDDAVRSLLNAARQRSSAAQHAQQQYQQQQQQQEASAGGNNNASPLSSTTSSHHQSLPLYPPTPGRGRAPSEERRLDSELMSHLELTNRHCSELEQRIERYETDMHTAMARNEELQLRLDASLLRERALSEKVGMLGDELVETRETATERASATEQLQVETTKLMMRLNTQLEHNAQLESKLQTLESEHRRLADDSARLRGANEALHQNVEDLESETAAMKVSNERREEDLRQKIVILSRELASVREQRDQALRPYHARHAASSSNSAAGMQSSSPLSSSSSPAGGYRGQHGAASSPSAGGSAYGHLHNVPSGLKSPPPGPTLLYRGTVSNPSPLHATDDVHELKRQVQWLLERTSK